MWIDTFLRDQGDHFRVTIYKSDRIKLNLDVNDIMFLRVNGEYIVRKILKDYCITLPKKLIYTKGKIKIKVIKKISQKEGLSRPEDIFYNNHLDLKYFIPEKTIYENQIYVLELNNNKMVVWYPVGGGANHIILKRFIGDYDELIEVLGFLFGDGSLKGVRSVRFTNCEPSTLQNCITFFDKIGISRVKWKAQVIYSSPSRLSQKYESKCKLFWYKMLKIPKENIISVLHSKSKYQNRKSTSARIFIDNAVLSEIFINGLLPNIIPLIKKPDCKETLLLTKSFLRGILAAEGSVQLKKGSLCRICVAFDPHSDECLFFERLLLNIGISKVTEHKNANELYICGWKNFEIFYKEDMFRFHSNKHKTFEIGFKNHRYSKNIFKV